MKKISSMAVYCGSSIGNNHLFFEAAENIGKFLANNNIKLIYGGGNLGIMGAVSDVALKNGGEVMGVITSHLINKEKINEDLTDIHIVDSMSERKNKMFNAADAFLILPGGIGTLEEFFEILSWKQLKIHSKDILIYNVNNYWDDLNTIINKTIDCKFTHSNIKDDYKIINNINDLTNYIN
jgi:uncharacterized protein (TIGR00730 family)